MACAGLPLQRYVVGMLRRHHLSCRCILFGIATLAAPAPARPGSLQRAWVHLGARQVDFRSDHDVLHASGEGRFKHIRLVVDGGDLELFDVRITFGDGKTFSPTGRFSFTGKSRSRGIALPGAARTIRWINFFYRGNCTVHVYGRR